jgi:hypothetical protein
MSTRQTQRIILGWFNRILSSRFCAKVCAGVWLFGVLVVLGPVGFAQTPPSFPPSVLGQRVVDWDYTGLRPIAPTNAVGVHPRIFIGPEDRADVCSRLTNSIAGKELFNGYIQQITRILRQGRSYYDTNSTSFKTMPDGTSRIGNVGYYDQSVYYTNLVAGSTNQCERRNLRPDACRLYGA